MKNLNLEINYYKNKNIKPIYAPTFFWNKLINNNYKAIKNGKFDGRTRKILNPKDSVNR